MANPLDKEDAGHRVRYGFYRDILGGVLKYKKKGFNISFFKGKPLINLLPPTLESEDRRLDNLLGFQGGFKTGTFKLGSAYIFNQLENKDESFLSFNSEAEMGKNLDIYIEYAHETDNYLDLDEQNRFGIYGSVNYYPGRFGLSFEYKYYKLCFL